MTRGASRGAVRAVKAEESPRLVQAVECARCGALLDFDEPDPLGIGRTMQCCTNPRCPDRVLRAVPVRRV